MYIIAKLIMYTLKFKFKYKPNIKIYMLVNAKDVLAYTHTGGGVWGIY